ncbi:MAG: AAA family ATPase [Candidatus Paceibacterota bacterium]|jgi:RecA-family ATPase
MKNIFNPKHVSELLNAKFTNSEWVVKDLVPSEGLTFVSAPPSSYKTWLIAGLAIAVAKGEKLFGIFETKQSSVLIVDEESGCRQLQSRLKLLGVTSNVPIYFCSKTGYKIEEMADQTLEFATEKNIGLIIYDSLIRIHDRDENSASEMSKVFQKLQVLGKEKAVISIHHTRKSQDGLFLSREMRGSSDILAVADSHVSIKRLKNEQNCIYVEQTKLRQEKEHPQFKLRFDDKSTPYSFAYEPTEKKDNMLEINKVVAETIRTVGKPICQKDLKKIIDQSGKEIGMPTLTNILSELSKKGEIFRKKGLGNAILFSKLPF